MAICHDLLKLAVKPLENSTGSGKFTAIVQQLSLISENLNKHLNVEDEQQFLSPFWIGVWQEVVIKGGK